MNAMNLFCIDVPPIVDSEQPRSSNNQQQDHNHTTVSPMSGVLYELTTPK